VDDFTSVMPADLLRRARKNNNELVFPYPEVMQAIAAATEKDVAILGVEVFEIDDGLRVQDYSGYEFNEDADWRKFVQANNAAALEFVHNYSKGEGHGYILTATSEREFRHLK
jgi:hypothetical protein